VIKAGPGGSWTKEAAKGAWHGWQKYFERFSCFSVDHPETGTMVADHLVLKGGADEASLAFKSVDDLSGI